MAHSASHSYLPELAPEIVAGIVGTHEIVSNIYASDPVGSASGDTDDDPASTLERFNLEVENRLGKGSFGTAWLVHHRDRPHIPRVVKVPRRGKMLPLRSEAEILKTMHHPLIVRFHDLIEVPGTDRAFLVMEYCEDGSLDGLLRRKHDAGQRLSSPEVARYIYDILRALEHIHLMHIFHLDVK